MKEHEKTELKTNTKVYIICPCIDLSNLAFLFAFQSSKVISQHLRKDHSQLVATDISTIVDKYARLTCRLCNFSSTKVGLWMEHFQRGPYGRTFCPIKNVGGGSPQKDHRGLNVTSTSQPVQENTITGSESNSEAHSRARIPSKTKALSRSGHSIFICLLFCKIIDLRLCKLMTPHWEVVFLFRSFPQLPHICNKPLP